MRPAVVDADAGGDRVVVAEDLVGVGQLRRRARAQRARPIAVDFAERRARSSSPSKGISKRCRAGAGGHSVYNLTWSYVIVTDERRSARIKVADVAVVMRLGVAAEIGVAVECQRGSDVRLIRQGDHLRCRVGRLRGREHSPGILLREFKRRRTGDAEAVGASRHAQVDLIALSPIANIAISALGVRLAEIAEAVGAKAVDIDVIGPIAFGYAVLSITLGGVIHPALETDLAALPVKAVLHVHNDGAGDRIKAKNRIAGHDLRVADRRWRNEIPIDDVAIGFVDTNAVHVDGKAFRRAGNGRSGFTAEIDGLREGSADFVGD